MHQAESLLGNKCFWKVITILPLPGIKLCPSK